jgi:serine O-acetyltransferase
MMPALWQPRMALSAVRLLPHIGIFVTGRNIATVQADLRRASAILLPRRAESLSDYIWLFVYFMTFTPEFRNLFYLRSGRWSLLFAWLCPRLASLDLGRTPIGPGLFIQHGEGTFITARKVGANCWIGRQVVVGYSAENKYPTIGDNVRIFAGAKIIGDILIGDGATIGLNSVVVSNVPPGATMLGVPARIMWRNAQEAKPRPESGEGPPRAVERRAQSIGAQDF